MWRITALEPWMWLTADKVNHILYKPLLQQKMLF